MFAHILDTLPTTLRQSKVMSGAAAHSRDDVRFIRLKKSIIRYRKRGDHGPVLLVATDPPVVLEQYDELLAALAENFQVIVFEVPGFGFSLPNLRFNFSINDITDTLTEFMIRLDINECTLAFPCILGFIAIALGHQLDHVVKRIVVMQQPDWNQAQAWKAVCDPKNILQTPIVGQLAMHALKTSTMQRWFHTAVGHAHHEPDFVRNSQSGFDHGACFCLASGFQSILGSKDSPIGPLNKPALAIWGLADRSHKHTDTSSTLNLLPNAHLVKIPDAGHFPELETTDEFVRHLMHFVLQ